MFSLIKAETDENCSRGGVLKKKKGFSSERKFCVVVSLFLLDMESDHSDLVAPLTSFDHLAAYTYFPVCLDCLPVCRAYTCGSKFGCCCSSAGTVTALVGLFCVGSVKDT